MLAAGVRSGLTETTHEGVIVISYADGSPIAWSGDVERPFYLRSSAKPFQAYVSQEAGAGLDPIELAQACASHRGFPMHVAMVKSILEGGGLDASHLRCPPDWPIGTAARDLLVASGEKHPQRRWHNCSGKHAGFLRACVAQGWPLETYLDPGHPLQRRIVEFVTELGEYDVQSVGVDGCGAPVLRTTARAMAKLYARLGSEERLGEVFTAMHRYPALIAANGEGDTEIAVATNSVAKGGAAGCLGIALDSGIGIAVKSWDGRGDIANTGGVAALESIGALSATALTALSDVGSPPVFGGGRVVGVIEPRLDLEFA